MQTHSKAKLTTFDFMDASRAVAAFLVFFNHARDLIFLDVRPGMGVGWKAFYFLAGFGHQAVMIFFVLSGYWIAKTVARRIENDTWSWGDYAIDRLTRLWIVLIPALLIGVALDLIGRYGLNVPLYHGLTGTHAITWDVASRLNGVTFLGNLVFVQTLLVQPLGSNGPLWSLANEFWYYVWFPVLYQLIRTRRTAIAMAILAVITMVSFSSLMVGFLCWLFGALLFFATRRMPPTGRTRLWIAPAALLFAAALIYSRVANSAGLSLGTTPGAAIIMSLVTDPAIGASFALALYAMLRSAASFPRWLSPICRFGAGSSFSLYVFHFPMLLLLCAIFAAPATRLAPSIHALALLAAISSVTILYAWLMSRFTEIRTSRVKTWIRARWPILTLIGR